MVLAGGTSRRFGRDKLTEPLGEGTLLASAVSGLPSDVRLLVVGPTPPDAGGSAGLSRARWVREDPPGGGPAAAIITGLRAALDAATQAEPVDAIVVLPGDAPNAGWAACQLLAQLLARGVDAVVGLDPSGREQPLQLALRPVAARALVAAAGPSAGSGASARALVARLDPPPLRHELSAGEAFDIDTPDQLVAWQGRDAAPVRQVLAALADLRSRAPEAEHPLVLALDGPSGTGKSTLAAALQLRTEAVVVAGDDFYGSVLPTLTAEQRSGLSDAEVVAAVFDWRRLRTEALTPLRTGGPTTFRAYDWVSNDGRLGPRRSLRPRPLVIVEGVYSGRPELADLVDLAVYVGVDPAMRRNRLANRGDDPAWAALWDRGEQYYFTETRPPGSFELEVTTDG